MIYRARRPGGRPRRGRAHSPCMSPWSRLVSVCLPGAAPSLRAQVHVSLGPQGDPSQANDGGDDGGRMHERIPQRSTVPTCLIIPNGAARRARRDPAGPRPCRVPFTSPTARHHTCGPLQHPAAPAAARTGPGRGPAHLMHRPPRHNTARASTHGPRQRPGWRRPCRPVARVRGSAPSPRWEVGGFRPNPEGLLVALGTPPT